MFSKRTKVQYAIEACKIVHKTLKTANIAKKKKN